VVVHYFWHYIGLVDLCPLARSHAGPAHPLSVPTGHFHQVKKLVAEPVDGAMEPGCKRHGRRSQLPSLGHRSQRFRKTSEMTKRAG